MINAPLVVTLVTYTVVFTVYGLYTVLILRNGKSKEYIQLIDCALMKPFIRQNLPDVTILVPTYNEEAVISRKLQNVADLTYPIEKIEVLLIDDCSNDRTCEIARNMYKKLGLRGRVIRNHQRTGVNASYNKGVPNASSNLILRTDADVTIEASALEKAVKILSEIEDAGGITGRMVHVTDRITAATVVENSYRTLFDQMSTAESATHSTFPGGGGFALLKKSCFSPISINRGSTDGNISLSIIKKGFRYVYVPHIFSYETISHKLGEQRRQKVRRATRVIQSALMNRDILFRKEFQKFGMIIFPLRFAMLTICPVLLLAGIVSTFFAILTFSVVQVISLTVAACFLLYLGIRTNIRSLNFVTSFLIHQLYLLLGLLFLGRRMSTWEKTARYW